MTALSNKTMRVRSLQGYRALMDEQLHLMRMGKITSNEYKQRIAGLMQQAEAFMVEQTLRRSGVADIEPGEHPLGADGGVILLGSNEAVRPITKKVTVRKGFDKMGNPISDIQIILEGGETMTEQDAKLVARQIADQNGIDYVEYSAEEPLDIPQEVRYDVEIEDLI